MTLSQRIRKAALGPMPRSWLMNDRSGAGVTAATYLGVVLYQWLYDATDTERRFFLLFVAEALE